MRSFERDLLGGRKDGSLAFTTMCGYLQRLGFSVRIRGSHHIFWHQAIPEILNLQPQGSRCKKYQVRQVRTALLRNGLRL